MERFCLAGEEGSPSDPSLECTAPPTETGIEAPMWRLGLGGESYPERTDEPDCIYYIRTGTCGYGSRCRFNHPPNHTPVLESLRTETVEFPERMGEPVCQHFMRTGTCKYRVSCKYHHPRQGGRGDIVTPISLNHIGYPLRPGEKECSYYLRTGHCKFGSTCRFHHPLPPSAIYPQSLPIPRPQLLPGSYVQSPYGYSQMMLPPGMVPYSGWNPYQASVNVMPSPGTRLSMGSSSVYGLSPSAPAYQSGPFPQRSGQPECQYFMRTGDCKFGSSCRYNHPLKAINLSRVGPTLRPDVAQGTHSSSPYPLGSSSLGTLAPSSTYSSEQRTEVLSSSFIKPETTISAGGSETVAAGVSSSSVTSGVSHTAPAETNKGEPASTEAKT